VKERRVSLVKCAAKYLIELNLLKMGKNNKNNKKKQVEPTKAEQTT